MNLVFIIVAIVLLVNISLSFSLVFIERKEPTTTWAWLLIMLILPGIGFVIYLLLGQNFSRERLFKEKKKIDKYKRFELSKNWAKNREEYYADQKYIDLIKMNFNHSGADYTLGNDVQLFFNGKDKFKQLILDLKNAKRYIHIQYYIFKRDSLGKEILKILEDKASEGLEIRFLVDSMGSYTLTKRLLKKFIDNGGKFEIFFPGILPHINTRVNYRNHRKMVIIDGEYGYTGGFNVGDEYINLDKKIGFWRDTHIRIKGEAVNDLTDRFLLDWGYASGEDIEEFEQYYSKNPYRSGNCGIQIVTSGPDHNEEYIKNAYIKMISNAKKNVYLETPYLVPDEPMLDTIKIAALSGVDVRIIIPGKPDHPFMKWAASSYCGDLLEAGVRIFTYNKGFIHSKTIVADSEVSTVGTANMDIRSFRLNFEVNAFIFNKQLAKEMEEQFLIDIEESNELTIEEYKYRPNSVRMKESVIRLISPIL
jgi:cardiolipin synthase